MKFLDYPSEAMVLMLNIQSRLQNDYDLVVRLDQPNAALQLTKYALLLEDQALIAKARTLHQMIYSPEEGNAATADLVDADAPKPTPMPEISADSNVSKH